MSSFNYFKSFETLVQESEILKVLRAEFQNYYAHLHPEKLPETLIEHTERVADFALSLAKSHQLEATIHRLIKGIIDNKNINSPDEAGNYIKKLFWHAIVFHDLGKMNENFQYYRMQNKKFRPNRANSIGNQHSILSAYLFISIHLNELFSCSTMDEETKSILYALVYLFTIPILRHHASFIEKEFEFSKDLIQSLLSYLNKIHLDIKPETIRRFFGNYDSYLEDITNHYFNEKSNLAIYFLLKLCYSLLTASDYCATSSYSMELHVEDFGVFHKNEVELLLNNFKETKNYNKEFFYKRNQFEKISFEELKECNTDNLNLLRKKLLDEVLKEINVNFNQNIFYLEAPTGSGKTNISIGAALELLRINPEINKIFYVFPFTTLITQTAKTIHETLDLAPGLMVQLHSRSGFISKREETDYETEFLNYIDYLFVNFPITLLTHVKFFEILKGNSKETNYLFHRLANSVIIIDELQSYPPREWDKIAYFISELSHYFNIKFILMSATLPKLDNLKISNIPVNFHSLIKNKTAYFQNANFKNRVQFDFSLLDEKIDLEQLASFVIEKCANYESKNKGNVKAIIEFIYKKTASDFFHLLARKSEIADYQILLLSGTILEPRRREIIDFIKEAAKENSCQKILLISTQVVEAGVDIDMDLGFKDRSLIDSDEQLAGRVNRNASLKTAMLYIFNLDPEFRIYGNDLRYRVTRDSLSFADYKTILANKDFDFLYQKVCQQINKENADEFVRGFDDYKKHIKQLHFTKIDREFKIIDQYNITIYVPLKIPAKCFSKNDLEFLRQLHCYDNQSEIDGEDIWYLYLDIIQCKNTDFIKKKIEIKKLFGIMSQFMFSIYAHSRLLKDLLRFCDDSYLKKYEILYLSSWQEVYDYNTGINDDKFNDPVFI